MLFLVDQDLGHLLVGYLVPDSVTQPGRYVVTVSGEEVYRGETDVVHPDLVGIGRHQTGCCGFVISEAHIPNLAQIPELDVVDIGSGLTIYRRRRLETVLPKRIFRLETHLLPLAGLDRSLEPRFQLCFPHIDRIGSETVHQIFKMKSNSVFVSGRVAYPAVDHYLEKAEYETFVVLHDPFDELAERLLFLRLVAQKGTRILGERDNVSFAETLAFAKEADFRTDKSLRHAFRTIDSTVAGRLANPLVRQLSARDFGEPLTGTSVSKAASALAACGVVGLRSRPDLLTEALTGVLGLKHEDLTVAPPIPAATELAERLRSWAAVEDLLEYDLALYHIVTEAFEKSFMPGFA